MSKTKKIPVSKKINFHIISLFPESCFSYIQESIIARAQKEKRISITFHNPRDAVKAKASQKGKDKPYLRVDDKPYGGGPGMVIEALPVIRVMEKIYKKIKDPKKTQIVFLSPGGEQFTTEKAKQMTSYDNIIIICGRYEGIDERINKIFKTTKLSVGPFVTTGGELPALIMLDVVSRQIPGVLGNFDSREEERVASHEVYTRPEVLEYKGKKYKVPAVLLSGDHKKIDEWRAGQKSD